MVVKMGFLPIAVLLGASAAMGVGQRATEFFKGANASKSEQMGAVHYRLSKNWESQDISPDTRLFSPKSAGRPGAMISLTRISANPNHSVRDILLETVAADSRGEQVIYCGSLVPTQFGNMGSGLTLRLETQNAQGVRNLTRYCVTEAGGNYWLTRFRVDSNETNDRFLPDYTRLLTSMEREERDEVTLASTSLTPTL